MKRILTAIVLIIAVLALIFFGKLWMITAIAFIVALPNFPVDAQLPVLSALTLILFAWNGFRSPLIQVLPDTAQGLFGLIWIAYPLTLVPLLWKQEDGPA